MGETIGLFYWYQGKPVWVGQTSTRLGGRFSDEAPSEVTLPLDPYVDESRNDLTNVSYQSIGCSGIAKLWLNEW